MKGCAREWTGGSGTNRIKENGTKLETWALGDEFRRGKTSDLHQKQFSFDGITFLSKTFSFTFPFYLRL